MSSILDSISKTSLLTAAMRAVETNRTLEQGRLFSDPYAEILAGDEGKNILEKAIKASGDQPAIAIRTRFVDDKMSAAIKNGCRQIVILASGMDTRAYRLNFSQDICIFELDREEVLNYKSEKLLSLKPKSVEPHSHLISIPVDLKTDWTSSLVKAGFKKSEKTFWLVEGLLMYLHEEDVITLFNRINSLVSKDDRLVFDILSQSLLKARL